jgi:outer membrane protein assembly factor BamB
MCFSAGGRGCPPGNRSGRRAVGPAAVEPGPDASAASRRRPLPRVSSGRDRRRRLRRRTLFLCAAVVVSMASASGSASRTPHARSDLAWLAYGHDGQLTNFVRSSTVRTASGSLLHVLWQVKLDGPIVASPLFAPGRFAGGVTGDIVVAETEAGTIYALSAGDGRILWQRNFGTVTTPGDDEDCGTYGFSSTGAIDPGRGLVYAISADGAVHALGLGTGTEAAGWPVDVTTARNRYEYVWGGLRIVANRLYVGVASYCDQPDQDNLFAEGRLVSIDLDDPADQVTFDPVPGFGNGGGIWSWGGVSVEPNGTALYTGVGNSYVLDPSCDCYVDTAGHGEQMLKLTPDLQVASSNRPSDLQDTGDDDFGSSPVLFQPPGCGPLAAANNKLGRLYIWNRNQLERGPIVTFGLGDGLAAFVGAPSYSPELHTLFEGHTTVTENGEQVGEGVQAITVDAQCHFHLDWLTRTGDGNEPPPLIIDDLVFTPGGDPGDFTALSARDGRRLWTFSTNGAPAIAPAIAAKNVIYAGDTAGILRAFGL